MELKTTNNFQLEEYANKLGLPLNNILMRDEMNKLNEDGFYIINLDSSDNQGDTLDMSLFPSFK